MSKRKGIDRGVTDLYKKILDGVDDTTALEDKLAILNVGVKLEQLKIRIQDEEYGKDFDLGGQEDEA